MDDTVTSSDTGETHVIRVRYWASARAAASCDGDDVPVPGPVSLADLVVRAASLHPGSDLARVLGFCSVLLGEQPVSSSDPESVEVPPGAYVEFLPPFAGG